MGADAGEDGEGGGQAGGRAAEDGRDSLVHEKSWRHYGCSSATLAIRSTSTSTSTSSLFYSYEYKCFSLYVHAYGQISDHLSQGIGR